jgi:hypothetical protein
MIELLLVLMVGTTASTPSQADILSAWTRRNTEVATADLAWKEVRNSRSENFGFIDNDRFDRRQKSASWRIRLSGSKLRVDGQSLTVAGRDHRSRPIAADPQRARLEFNELLLERKLEGTQRFPQQLPITALVTKNLIGHRLMFGELEELLIQAPILAMRPLLLINPEQIVVTNRKAVSVGGSYAILKQQISTDSECEYWLDRDLRIVRMTQISNSRTTAQIDIRYSEKENVPSEWTVQRLDDEGNPFEFVQAELTKVELNPQLNTEVFDLPSPWDEINGSLGTYNRLRPYLRGMIESIAFIFGVPTVLALMLWKRFRANSAGYVAASVRATLVFIFLFWTIVFLQQTPIFAPSVSDGYYQLMGFWAKMQSLQQNSVDRSEWDVFAKTTLAKLKIVSDEQTQCQARAQHGVWPLLAGRDEASERARVDLITAARHDFPEVLRAWPAPNDLRERSLLVRLDNLRDHVDGESPYRVPVAAPASAWKVNPMLVVWATSNAIIVAWILIVIVRRAQANRAARLGSAIRDF